PATFPSAVRVINPAVHPLRVEPHRIRHAQNHPFPVLEREQSLRRIAGVDRRVPAQPERVELIDPRVVARLRAAGILYVLELREPLRVERPALGTMLSCRRGSVERPLAFPTIEARHVAARHRDPRDAIAVDVHPAWRVPDGWHARIVERRLIVLR